MAIRGGRGCKRWGRGYKRWGRGYKIWGVSIRGGAWL